MRWLLEWQWYIGLTKHPLLYASLKWELQVLTVLLETFYLGRINKLQLVFWDGLVICSWSRMIWLTSKELLHLGRQHPIYLQFWEKHYPLDKTVDQELKHSSGAWSRASLFTQMPLVPFSTLSLYTLGRCPWCVIWLWVFIECLLLTLQLLLSRKIHASQTKSLILIHYPQVLPPNPGIVWFRKGSFSLSGCDKWWVNSESVWNKERF